MRLSIVKNLGWLVLAALGTASRADAGIITVPPGLSPGDTYRLVFVTSDTTTATSLYIDYYNAFVSLEADSVPALAALDATWTVIGSTESVSAASNIGTDLPGMMGIYTLDGVEVAPTTEALFNTHNILLINPIDINQHADLTVSEPVWTGTIWQGVSSPLAPLGDLTIVNYGRDTQLNAEYLDEGGRPPSDQFPLYAISSPLIVTAEPTTIGLSALGLALLVLTKRSQQQNRKATRTLC